METISNILNDFKVKYITNESIAGLIRKKINEKINEKNSPKKYFYLTDLCNPIQTYWKFKKPENKKSQDLIKILSIGTKLHIVAGKWFQKIPGFIFEEGLLDGAYVDIPGVRGKIDFRIKNSLVELKTKPKLPENENEVMELYTQDLEQIIFYSVLHTEGLNENYLVFMLDKEPYSIKAYKVVTKKPHLIKEKINTRIKVLTKAIEDDDPSKLGQCRYFKNNCEFKENQSCNCEDLKSLKYDYLQDSIELNYDEDFTKILQRSQEPINEEETFYYKNNILSPRDYYLDKFTELEKEPYKNELRGEWESYLSQIVSDLEIAKLGESEKEDIKNSIKDKRLRLGFKWLKTINSSNPSNPYKNLPYLIKISGAQTSNGSIKPHSFPIADLGVVTANYGLNKGLLIVLYPNLDMKLNVFEIEFKDPNKRLKIIQEIMNNFEKLHEDNLSINLLDLPPCEDFFNEKNKCPMHKKCHEVSYKGCQY